MKIKIKIYSSVSIVWLGNLSSNAINWVWVCNYAFQKLLLIFLWICRSRTRWKLLWPQLIACSKVQKPYFEVRCKFPMHSIQKTPTIIVWYFWRRCFWIFHLKHHKLWLQKCQSIVRFKNPWKCIGNKLNDVTIMASFLNWQLLEESAKIVHIPKLMKTFLWTV